jgi:ASC-1-like (ASCH) protein
MTPQSNTQGVPLREGSRGPYTQHCTTRSGPRGNDLVASGVKTIEARVRYPNLRNLAEGDHIRFVCGGDDCLTRVKRVALYPSFEAMIDAEGPEKVNPTSPRDQQLANIRRIYGPEKEALGVLAIEIERLEIS